LSIGGLHHGSDPSFHPQKSRDYGDFVMRNCSYCGGDIPEGEKCCPLWLNEGVAVRVERFMTRPSEPMLHRELADQHRNHWTETNIQEFWAGASFGQPGDPQTLSYSSRKFWWNCSRAIINNSWSLCARPTIATADKPRPWIASASAWAMWPPVFLAPGDWRPYRKALTNIWRDSEKSEG
jgi:hypothetical protein